MMKQKEAVKKYFDKVSSDYEKAYEFDSKDPIRTYIFNKRKEIVLDLIDSRKGQLLDIGCGPGVMTKELLKKDFLIFNIDISASMIEKAKKALEGLEGMERVCFKVGDIENLDFGSSYFDVILCIGVIEYLQDYHETIEKITRILKKGGIVVISVPNRWSIFHIIDDSLAGIAFKVLPGIFKRGKNTRQEKVTTKKFVPSRFAKELEKYGLSEVSVKLHGYRLGILRRFFPKFWIFLNDVLNKITPPLIAVFLANDCVIKFRKDIDV